MIPYAARFGYTERDFKSNRELESRLMDQYAKERGYEPTASWILVVHTDGSTDYYPFDDPREMWCCTLTPLIRYLEYFTNGEDHRNPREDQARAVGQFLAWCNERRLSLRAVWPADVVRYAEELTPSQLSLDRDLAAVRMLFEWLVTGEVIPANPVPAAMWHS